MFTLGHTVILTFLVRYLGKMGFSKTFFRNALSAANEYLRSYIALKLYFLSIC